LSFSFHPSPSSLPSLIYCGQIFGSRVRVESTAKIAEIEEAEKQKMKDKVGKILAHNASVFINRQLIYNYPEQVRWIACIGCSRGEVSCSLTAFVASGRRGCRHHRARRLRGRSVTMRDLSVFSLLISAYCRPRCSHA
jgi:hypothetical protein